MIDRKPGWATEPKRLRYAAFDTLCDLAVSDYPDLMQFCRTIGDTAKQGVFSNRELSGMVEEFERRHWKGGDGTS